MWKRLSKYIGKYVDFLEHLDINLFVPYVSSASITIASFISAIGNPFRLKILFITLFFTLGSWFVKLFLSIMKTKKGNKTKLKY